MRQCSWGWVWVGEKWASPLTVRWLSWSAWAILARRLALLEALRVLLWLGQQQVAFLPSVPRWPRLSWRSPLSCRCPLSGQEAVRAPVNRLLEMPR